MTHRERCAKAQEIDCDSLPGAAMINDDVVKCPLCGSFAHIDKPELLAVLTDPRIRLQVEEYVAELLHPASSEFVPAGQPRGEDRKDAHHWNPSVPGWRRSPKE